MVRSDDIDVREVRRSPVVRLARWLLGAGTLVGGLTWILVTLHGPSPVLDLLIGVVLTAGGLVLLMPHRIELPRRATTIAVVLVGLAGTAGGLAYDRVRTCCSFAAVEDRGWPFAWLQRGAVADDPGTARLLTGSASWSADVLALAGNLLLWAYVGMLVMVVVVQVRRPRS